MVTPWAAGELSEWQRVALAHRIGHRGVHSLHPVDWKALFTGLCGAAYWHGSCGGEPGPAVKCIVCLNEAEVEGFARRFTPGCGWTPVLAFQPYCGGFSTRATRLLLGVGADVVTPPESSHP